MLEKKNYKIKSVDLFEQPPTKKKKKRYRSTCTSVFNYMLFCSIYWAQFLQMLQVVLKSLAQRLLMSEVVSLFISNILLLSYSLTANGPVLVRLETKTGFMQFLLQHVSLLHRFFIKWYISTMYYLSSAKNGNLLGFHVQSPVTREFS